MCRIYADEGAFTLANSKVRVARKAHRCHCCGATVRPGDRYRYATYLHEGSWGEEKTCLPCDEAIDKFGDAHDAYPGAAYFAQVLAECIAEGDDESEEKWRPMLKEIEARRVAP